MSGVTVSPSSPIVGVDYSFSRPDPATLYSLGYRFAIRYLSGISGKDLSVPEKQSLLAAGLAICVVFETDGRTGPLRGAPGGVADATAAVAQARSLGIPPGTCLYFAVDFDALGAQLALVRAYGQAATPVCHAAGYRSGLYGGYATAEDVTGAVDLLMQTIAWSGGQWDPAAVLRQVQEGVVIGGAQVDIDHAVAADYGQFPQEGEDMLGILVATIKAGPLAGQNAEYLCDLMTWHRIQSPQELEDLTERTYPWLHAGAVPPTWDNGVPVADILAFGRPQTAQDASEQELLFP